ncbi:unnamed protein product [Trichobilharzia regenti]|nr:unnamed protein product [Trichobilharzia regenti]
MHIIMHSPEKCSDLAQFSHPGSLSTSTNSLDNLSCEAIKTILFTEWSSSKQDQYNGPNIWIGTSRGCVVVLNLKYRVLNSTPISQSYNVDYGGFPMPSYTLISAIFEFRLL